MSRRRNPETDSWMWLFAVEDEASADPALSLHRDKGAKVPCGILRGVPWISETDGYQGYNNLPDIKQLLLQGM